MNLSDCLLLANIEDVLKTVLPIIFMILYGVAQLVSGKQQQDKRKAAQRQRPATPEVPGAAPRQPGGQQPNVEQSLRREVEEFLRRAQGQPSAGPVKRDAGTRPQPTKSGQAGRPSGRRPERPSPRGPAPPVQRESDTRRLTPASTPISPMGPPGSSSGSLGSGVAQHVSQHLGGGAALAQHAQQLGADVALADDRLQQHLKEKFVHQVGNLAPQATAPQRRTGAASPMAGEFLKLLSSPEGVRQAFIASEIFRRPEDRWDQD